jgi:predicted RNA polymerase sigma factor
VTGDGRIDDLLRELAPQVLAGLVRRWGRFDACEDAVQEALLAAALQWPGEGLPENPAGWLLTVAGRRLADAARAEQVRRRREDRAAAQVPRGESLAPPASDAKASDEDDTLTLLFLCCHPALTESSQIPLTLRAVGGLTTSEIARAFLVPEATMAQRISRAKQRIKESGAQFRLPPSHERGERLAAVLHVLYLIFNEGYSVTSGVSLQRVDLTAEATRLTGQLQRLLPDDGEVAGLLALMLLTDARRATRTDSTGALIPLAEQDRSRWDQAAIAEGVALITDALSRAPLGAYQLQAAIAAVHAEAPSSDETDWAQILALYDLLERMAPNPVVTLNRAVAVGMVHGPQAALRIVGTLEADARIAGHHRVDAVRAHLLELAGDRAAATAGYLAAAQRTTSIPERRYLEARAKRLLI